MARKSKTGTKALFGELLADHLKAGTRPGSKNGEPWTYSSFANEVQSSRDNEFVSPRSVSNWCNLRSVPTEFEPISRALFGPITSNRHDAARDALRSAFMTARAEKGNIALARTKSDPAGARWIAHDSKFQIDTKPQSVDQVVALSAVCIQLQHSIAILAEALASKSKRLQNSPLWGTVSSTASAICNLARLQGGEIADHLGEAYGLFLCLGQFLDTNSRIKDDSESSYDPLDLDVLSSISALVGVSAPWLRYFPTVRFLDDQAAKALVRKDLFTPASEFIRIAWAQDAIPEKEFLEMQKLAEVSNQQGFQGQKAGARTVGSARNLLIAVAQTLLSNVLEESELHNTIVDRSIAAINSATDEFNLISASLPIDLRFALQAIMDDLSMQGRREIVSKSESKSAKHSPPRDITRLVEQMISEGQDVPDDWCAKVQTLSFRSANITDIRQILKCRNLRSLEIHDTPIEDVNEIGTLSALHTLYLHQLDVKSLAPLKYLKALRHLNLFETNIENSDFLGGLASLISLKLMGTGIKDISSLSKSTFLRELDAWGCSIEDVSALSNHRALELLDLHSNPIESITPLKDLVRLRNLDLSGSRVNRVDGLELMHSMQQLNLSNTPLEHINALRGMESLTELNIAGTKISDMDPIEGMRNLETLNISFTAARSLQPLSRLNNLRRLNIGNNSIEDLSPLARLPKLSEIIVYDMGQYDFEPLKDRPRLRVTSYGGQRKLSKPISSLTK